MTAGAIVKTVRECFFRKNSHFHLHCRFCGNMTTAVRERIVREFFPEKLLTYNVKGYALSIHIFKCTVSFLTRVTLSINSAKVVSLRFLDFFGSFNQIFLLRASLAVR